uniref:Endoplasmic reticulum transmembrane protein n=1 Tax=Strigamia maritima TaxID=126957 RepID=T1J0F9_STRMM
MVHALVTDITEYIKFSAMVAFVFLGINFGSLALFPGFKDKPTTIPIKTPDIFEHKKNKNARRLIRIQMTLPTLISFCVFILFWIRPHADNVENPISIRMSFQWTIIAAFLYAEIGIVFILLLPFISPHRWQKLLKSRIFLSLGNQSSIYFNVFMIILFLFFFDAIREIKRYTLEVDNIKHDSHTHFDTDLQTHMKLFRSQRNFYISGFALFLWLVLRRLITLISTQATLANDKEAAIRQAKSASETAERLMKKPDESDDNKGNIVKEEYEKEILGLKQELDRSKEDLRRSALDVDAMKQQAQSVGRQYDTLMSEYDKLKLELEKCQDVKSDKKGD